MVQLEIVTSKFFAGPHLTGNCMIKINGKRIYCTQDVDYLLLTRESLADAGTTIILEADPDSMELPELGPTLDVQSTGPLRVSKIGNKVQFEAGVVTHRKDERTKLAECEFAEWSDAIDTFRSVYEEWENGNSEQCSAP